MIGFFIALLLTILFSFVPERFVKPTPSHFSKNNFILQASLVSSLFVFVSLIVQRPIFSALAVSIFLIIVSGVSNAKLKALREPLVFSDFAMFSQAFKHPRLYFPFLGFWPVVIMPLIIFGLIYALLMFEPAMAFTWQRVFLSLLAIIMLQGIARLIAQSFSLTQKPEEDIESYGLVNSAFTYAIQSGTEEHQEEIKKTLKKGDLAQFSSQLMSTAKSKNTPPDFLKVFENQLPNITVIQSESFFDARRMHSSIFKNVLGEYDRCLESSKQYGKLSVPAWGANTMRTEFAFLTGLKYPDLGLYKYYPYQYLHRHSITSLATILKSLDYHCVCIHPHPASFFGRKRIFPKMGFDTFIDIQDFDTKATFGPYISDNAVTEKIQEYTEAFTKLSPDKPLFIFAITMENHGPLHLEKTTKEEQQKYFSEIPLSNGNDLAVYLRHLKNADKQIADLTHYFQQSDKPQTLCFYGDHVPSMPKIYSQLAYEDEHSDYFIWQNDASIKTSKPNLNADIKADELAKILLSQSFNL